jgi:thioredoxin 1
MNTKNKKQQKMKFFRFNNVWMIILVLAVAAGITIAAVSESSKSMNSQTKNNVANEDPLVIHLNDDNFASSVGSGLVLVDFWATWCMPCRMQGPIVEKVATEMEGKVKVCKMDVDQNPRTSDEYGITSIPTILIFKNGKLVEQFVGLQKKQILIETLSKYAK